MSAAPGHIAVGSLWGPPAGGPLAGGSPGEGPLAGDSTAGTSPARVYSSRVSPVAAGTVPGPTPVGRDLFFHLPITQSSFYPFSSFFLFSPLLPSPDLLENSGGLGDTTQSLIVGPLKPDGRWRKVYSLWGEGCLEDHLRAAKNACLARWSLPSRNRCSPDVGATLGAK